jgi:hypothetical protein
MSAERTARGAALPFLLPWHSRVGAATTLFILCDTLIEGGEEGVESTISGLAREQVGVQFNLPRRRACRLVRTLDGRGCRMRRWLPEVTRTLPTARQLVRRDLGLSPWLNGTI